APKDVVLNFSVLDQVEQAASEDEFSGAAHLKTTVGTGAVVCLSSDILPVDRKNWYIPAWII
ncbi:MAG: ATPase, partial [Lachnospiraceae bacterium]|nr:ATPase [Lachnospiraceae bacterium]